MGKIIDEEGTEICYLNIPFAKIKMDSDVEPECNHCEKPLMEGNIVYTSEEINYDLCSNCFKRLKKSLSKTRSPSKSQQENHLKKTRGKCFSK